jgi:putative redox protein
MPVLEMTVTAKTATITLDGEGLRFAAVSGSGHALVLDDAQGDAGMRPAELIPIALAGCTAMDVISILRKKRQAVTGYRVLASGTQAEDHPNAFTRIDVLHVVEGESIDADAVRRAIQLSATKYCSVGATLSSGDAEVHHRFVLPNGAGDEHAEEVIVTGPHTSTDSAASGAPSAATASF